MPWHLWCAFPEGKRHAHPVVGRFLKDEDMQEGDRTPREYEPSYPD
jgi:predicted HAD superfamily Cof-like phosphohydrolase